jgi:hypothetical protein
MLICSEHATNMYRKLQSALYAVGLQVHNL